MSDTPAETGNRTAPSEARVDAAHSARDARPSVPSPAGRSTRIDPPAYIAGSQPAPAADDGEMLRLQAAQLATHLQRRQAELDRRETQANAASLRLDQDARSARLWFAERQHELDDRLEALDRLDRELADRRSQLAAAEHYHQTSQQELRAELSAREDELIKREAAVETQSAACAAQQLAQRRAAEDLEQARRQLDDDQRLREQAFANRQAESLRTVRLAHENLEQRRREIERQEAELSQRLAARQPPQGAEFPSERMAALLKREGLVLEAESAIERERQLLADERERQAAREELLSARHKQEQERLESSYRRLVATLDERRQGLERRQTELDARAAALDQLRANLEAVHRETLEIRLVTEELWAQLTSRVPGPALSPAIGQLRAKLADHFQLLSEQLDERRVQMQSAKSELAKEHGRLCDQRQHMHDWAQRRHGELDQLAARLMGRQDELDRRESACQALEDGWRTERLELQQQVSRLQTELRQALVGQEPQPVSPPKKLFGRKKAA